MNIVMKINDISSKDLSMIKSQLSYPPRILEETFGSLPGFAVTVLIANS